MISDPDNALISIVNSTVIDSPTPRHPSIPVNMLSITAPLYPGFTVGSIVAVDVVIAGGVTIPIKVPPICSTRSSCNLRLFSFVVPSLAISIWKVASKFPTTPLLASTIAVVDFSTSRSGIVIKAISISSSSVAASAAPTAPVPSPLIAPSLAPLGSPPPSLVGSLSAVLSTSLEVISLPTVFSKLSISATLT